MKEYNREIIKAEEKLIKEIEDEKKFTFRKLLRILELNALLSR